MKRKFLTPPDSMRKKWRKTDILTPGQGVPALPVIKYTGTGLGIRAHGEFCGPNYSDGKFQGSVSNPFLDPVDDLDMACRDHDIAYARGGNLLKADLSFARKTIGTGLKGTAFGAAVGMQGLLRGIGILSKGTKRLETDDSFFPVIETGRRMPAKRRSKVVKRKRSTKFTKKRKYKKSSNKKYKRSYSRRRPKSIKFRYNKRNASTLKVEKGGSKSDSEVAYIGHGVAHNRVQLALFMALTKELFASHGVTFKDWNETAINTAVSGTSLSITTYWTFGEDSNSTLQATSYTIPDAASFKTVADNIYSGLYTAWRTSISSTSIDPPSLVKMVLRTGTGAAPDYDLAKIDLRNMRMAVKYKSSIRFQNRTNAYSGGVATESTDVNTQAPVIATQYYGKYGRNFFSTKFTVSAGNGFVPDVVNGYFTQDAATMGNAFAEPPSAATVGAYKKQDYMLHPGQVLVDTWKWDKGFSLNGYIAKTLGGFTSETLPTIYPGYCRMFAFEKLVKFNSDGTNVNIVFELDTELTVSLRHITNGGMAYTIVS